MISNGLPSITSQSNGSSEFIRHGPCNNCGSSDGNAIYTDHSYCFVCHSYTDEQENIIHIHTTKNAVQIKGSAERLQKRRISQSTCERFKVYRDGDKLRFFMNKGDCERMGILFSFTTMKNHKNIQSLQDKTLPIKINGHSIDDAAKVVLVQNLFRDMNIVMMQAPGLKSVKDMISAMMAWYEDKNFFGIELVSEPGFDPQDYFDITDNNWKLDHLPEKIIQAQRLCFGPDELKTS